MATVVLISTHCHNIKGTLEIHYCGNFETCVPKWVKILDFCQAEPFKQELKEYFAFLLDPTGKSCNKKTSSMCTTTQWHERAGRAGPVG